MYVWWVIAGGVALLLWIVLESNVESRIYYRRRQTNDHVVVQVKALMGLIRYKTEIPVIRFEGWSQGILVERKKANQAFALSQGSERHEQVTLEKIKDYYDKAQLFLKQFVGFSEWFTRTLKHIHCTSCSWSTRIGLGDTVGTAISTGAVWAMKSSLLGFLSRYIRLSTIPKLDVQPDYNRLHFSTEGDVALTMRFGYLVLASFLFWLRFRKRHRHPAADLNAR
ncbi:DUF2953 domain-containing protein [Paenibacillus sp. y28]